VLKHLPETGESFRHDGWKFEIADMDGRKIDKLLVKRRSRKRSTEAADSGAGEG
jgi:putative hemolysin